MSLLPAIGGVVKSLFGGSGGAVVGSLAGDLLGGLLGAEGAEEANDANQAMSARQMAFNAAEAEKNRVFQDEQARQQMAFQDLQVKRKMKYDTRMANTAVSRRMADLVRSGVNPILAGRFDADSPSAAALSGASGGGTTTPSYSVIPSINQMAPLASTASGLLKDVIEIQRSLVETENAKKTGSYIEAQTKTEDEKPRQARLTQEKTVKEMEKLVTESETLRRALPKIDNEVQRTKAEARLREIEGILKSKDVPIADMQNKSMEKVQTIIDVILDKITPFINNSAKDLRDIKLPSR